MNQSFSKFKNTLLLGLVSLPLGALIGAVCTLFGRILLLIGDIRGAHPAYFLPFLAIAGLLIVYCYGRWGGTAAQGMGLVFKVGHGEAEDIPLRLVPFVMLGTWLTHLFGGSAGREGVAVQIGATVSHWLGKRLPIDNAPHILLVAGMSAGFAGLFRTPIAAIAFGLEVLTVGQLEFGALLPAMVASFTAAQTSALLGLEKFAFPVSADLALTPSTLVRLAVLGILFGVTGGLFAWSLRRAKSFLAERFPNPLLRIAVMGALLSVILLLLWNGRYSGLGTNLINASLNGNTIYKWDFILKLVLTVLTLATGYQGGEVTPLFSIGASLGAVLAGVLGFPVELAAALGYAAVFGSATNTLFAPVFIGAEVFGLDLFPVFIVCGTAYLVNGGQSIYNQRKGQ